MSHWMPADSNLLAALAEDYARLKRSDLLLKSRPGGSSDNAIEHGNSDIARYEESRRSIPRGSILTGAPVGSSVGHSTHGHRPFRTRAEYDQPSTMMKKSTEGRPNREGTRITLKLKPFQKEETMNATAEEKHTPRQLSGMRKLAVRQLAYLDELRGRLDVDPDMSGQLLAERKNLLDVIQDLDRELAETGQASEEQQEQPMAAMAKAVAAVRGGRLSFVDGLKLFKSARDRARETLMKSLPGQVALGEEGLCGAAQRAFFMKEFPQLGGDPEGWFAER